jgi:hypothetical protein
MQQWLHDLLDAVASFLEEKLVIDGLDLSTAWDSFVAWLKTLV